MISVTSDSWIDTIAYCKYLNTIGFQTNITKCTTDAAYDYQLQVLGANIAFKSKNGSIKYSTLMEQLNVQFVREGISDQEYGQGKRILTLTQKFNRSAWRNVCPECRFINEWNLFNIYKRIFIEAKIKDVKTEFKQDSVEGPNGHGRFLSKDNEPLSDWIFCTIGKKTKSDFTQNCVARVQDVVLAILKVNEMLGKRLAMKIAQ